MTVERYKIKDTSYPYFITATIRQWYPLLADKNNADLIIESLRYFQRENLKIYAFVIMKTHMHLVVKSETLKNDLRRFRSFTATSLIKRLKEQDDADILNKLQYFDKSTRSKHRVWEPDMHPEMLYYDAMMKQKIRYIHQNPVRAGFVIRPEDWLYSSAVNYAGATGILDVVTDW